MKLFGQMETASDRQALRAMRDASLTYELATWRRFVFFVVSAFFVGEIVFEFAWASPFHLVSFRRLHEMNIFSVR
jgi:hypothetical protein